MPRMKYCRAEGKIIIHTELDAKIILAKRIAKDKGETRYYECRSKGHYHLTSQPIKTEHK